LGAYLVGAYTALGEHFQMLQQINEQKELIDTQRQTLDINHARFEQICGKDSAPALACQNIE